MTIGDKIRILRKGKGLNQTELGEILGVKTNAVSKWECGRVEDIPMSKVKAMAALFDVPISYLIDEDKREKAPMLNDKDKHDIAKNLEQMMAQLEDGSNLMFDGDPMSDEARESIRQALQMGLEIAKVKNKETYTPKKYRKG